MYIFQNISYVYIWNIYLSYKLYDMNINIFKIYTVCVCIYIYIHKTHTYIMQTKTFILDAINHD